MHVASHPQIPQCIRLALELDPVVQTDAQWWGSYSGLHYPQGPVFSLFSLFFSCSSGKPLSSCLVTVCSALFFPEHHRIETWHVFSSASLTFPMHVRFRVFLYPLATCTQYCSSWCVCPRTWGTVDPEVFLILVFLDAYVSMFYIEACESFEAIFI